MDLLAAMRIYVRVVERGSMSAAARDLGIGQPAVSERIVRLEQHLGVRLLRRNTRAISVTDMGLRFYERSQVVLAAAEEAQASVLQRKDHPLSGTLRIAAPQAFGDVVLPPILLRLREQHPHLNIDLVLNDRIIDPVTEGVDISLRLGQLGEGGFVARKLGHVRRLLVAAPAYLEQHAMPVQPTDLTAHSFLRVSGLFSDGYLPLIKDQASVSVPITVAWSLSHWRPMYALLLAGAGIGVLQEPVCAEDIASGQLVSVLPDYEIPGFALHALYPATKPVPLKTRALLALLKERLSTLATQKE